MENQPRRPGTSSGPLEGTAPSLHAPGTSPPDHARTDPLAPEQTEGREPGPAGEATQTYAGTYATEPVASTTPAARPPEPAPSKVTTLGDYRLVKKLGSGGMGSVYLARQISLDRDVALKVMSRELASKPAFIQRFLREARIMARLDHPNIVHCYGAGEAHGFHYLAMEYVDGGSLSDWLRNLDRLSVGDALHIILACAGALQHAHEQQLIHRDVKPDNVLISSKGVVKLADLGLAKALDEDLAVTKTGTGAGTPIYMAPEQARDLKRVDGRCDIYALGCMLYRCLTGKPPFEGETMVEVIEAKEKGKFLPARRANPEVPPRLDLIIDKMLAPKPEHRYQNCAEVIKDLAGLELANAALEFLRPADGPAEQPLPPPATRPLPPPGPPRVTAATRPHPPARPPVNPPHQRVPPKPLEAEEGDVWYVTYTNREGRVVTQKKTTGQVIELIRSPEFDPEMQASRTLNGGYRHVGTYKQFAGVVHGRVSRDTADRKASTFRSLYEKIEEEERKRKRRRWIHNLIGGFKSWVSIAFWLSVLVVGGALIVLLLRYFVVWVGEKINSL